MSSIRSSGTSVRASNSRALSLIAPKFLHPAAVNGSAMFPPAVTPNASPSAGSWYTTDKVLIRSWRRADGSRSKILTLPSSNGVRRTSPVDAATSPAIQRRTVDLPEPDSPTMPSASPAATSKLTPHAATMDAVTWSRAVPCSGPVRSIIAGSKVP